MKSKIYLLIFICLIKATNVFAQDSSAHSKHAILLNFAGLTQGEIVMADHLNDSLHFTSIDINFDSLCHVTSFHLTLTCKGHVLKYLENKSGNILTTEMQDAIKKLHPGCSVIFDGVHVASLDHLGEESHYKWDSFFSGNFKLKLTLN